MPAGLRLTLLFALFAWPAAALADPPVGVPIPRPSFASDGAAPWDRPMLLSIPPSPLDTAVKSAPLGPASPVPALPSACPAVPRPASAGERTVASERPSMPDDVKHIITDVIVEGNRLTPTRTIRKQMKTQPGEV
jgi:hypothetical protein